MTGFRFFVPDGAILPKNTTFALIFERMGSIELNKGFALLIVPYNDKVRVIVLLNNEEYVCRIALLPKLLDFAAAKEAHAFKGRLQLYKEAGLINVLAKGEVAGIIEENTFINYIEAVSK